MKKIIKKAIQWSVICLSSWSFIQIVTVTARADTGIGFSYYNHKPKNQLSEGSYFDLLVKPKMKQTLVTEIRNESAETITVKISINDSKTTSSGVIDYGPSSLKNTKGLRIKLSDILTGPTEIVLKKGEVKDLEFKLVMPEESFKGILLGGIELEKVTKKTVSTEKISVSNKYAYVYSISIRENETLEPYKLSAVKSEYVTTARDGKVEVQVSNDSQEIVKGLKIASVITSVAANEVLVEQVTEDMKMAPMSIMNYLVDFPDAEPGKYQVKTIATIRKETWSWVNEFEVLGQQQTVGTKELNEDNYRNINFGWLIAIISTVVIGTGILFITIRLYKKH